MLYEADALHGFDSAANVTPTTGAVSLSVLGMHSSVGSPNQFEGICENGTNGSCLNTGGAASSTWYCIGTGKLPDGRLAKIILKEVDLSPAGIIKRLNLRRPIYRKTAAFGHFGRTEDTFTWEAADKAEALREAAQLATTSA